MKKSENQIIIMCTLLAATWITCATLHASECPGSVEPNRNLPELKADPEAENMPGGALRIVFAGVANASIGDKDAACALTCGALELTVGPVDSAFKIIRFSWDRPQDYVVDTKGRDPWKNLYEVSLGVNHGGRITDRMRYALMLGATSGHENELEDSFSFHGGGYAIYTINPKWAIAAGAFYSKHQKVKTDFEFIPVASVSWNTETTSGPSFTIGLPSTEMTWHFSENTSLTLDTSSFEGGIYRLADNSPVSEKGYVEFAGTTCTLRLDTLVLDRVHLSAGLSHALSREHKLYDQDGKNEIKYDVEKKPGFLISMSLQF